MSESLLSWFGRLARRDVRSVRNMPTLSGANANRFRNTGKRTDARCGCSLGPPVRTREGDYIYMSYVVPSCPIHTGRRVPESLNERAARYPATIEVTPGSESDPNIKPWTLRYGTPPRNPAFAPLLYYFETLGELSAFIHSSTRPPNRTGTVGERMNRINEIYSKAKIKEVAA